MMMMGWEMRCKGMMMEEGDLGVGLYPMDEMKVMLIWEVRGVRVNKLGFPSSLP